MISKICQRMKSTKKEFLIRLSTGITNKILFETIACQKNHIALK